MNIYNVHEICDNSNYALISRIHWMNIVVYTFILWLTSGSSVVWHLAQIFLFPLDICFPHASLFRVSHQVGLVMAVTILPLTTFSPHLPSVCLEELCSWPTPIDDLWQQSPSSTWIILTLTCCYVLVFCCLKEKNSSLCFLYLLFESLFVKNLQVITKGRGIRMVRVLSYFYHVREPESDEEVKWFKNWCDEVLGNCLRKLIDPKPYHVR